MTPREEFIEVYTKYITRNGADELLEWLKRTDFFTAPASTKYHCACEGGLVMHSVSVFNTMMEKHYDEETDSIESVDDQTGAGTRLPPSDLVIELRE